MQLVPTVTEQFTDSKKYTHYGGLPDISVLKLREKVTSAEH